MDIGQRVTPGNAAFHPFVRKFDTSHRTLLGALMVHFRGPVSFHPEGNLTTVGTVCFDSDLRFFGDDSGNCGCLWVVNVGVLSNPLDVVSDFSFGSDVPNGRHRGEVQEPTHSTFGQQFSAR